MLQGSTYKLPIVIKDANGNVVDDTMVQKGVFTIGNVEKEYGLNGEVSFDRRQGAWIVPLTESETFNFNKGNIKWQARFLFTNGEIEGTEPRFDNVVESINKTYLTEV